MLDRANLIEFDVLPEDLQDDLPPLRDPDWSLRLTGRNFRRFCATAGDTRFRADLVRIAGILYPLRAQFGFGVREEIER